VVNSRKKAGERRIVKLKKKIDMTNNPWFQIVMHQAGMRCHWLTLGGPGWSLAHGPSTMLPRPHRPTAFEGHSRAA
jgi:hypothetical protein